MASNTYLDESLDDYLAVKTSRDFTGKVCLVTGSSSGIGAGIAKLFAILGAHVVVTGRDETRVNNVVQHIQQLSPNNLKPLGVVMDLTKLDNLDELFNKILAIYGQLDVLVNNAGIYPTCYMNDKQFPTILQSVFDINVKSMVKLIQLSVPYLEITKGSIINLSSIASIQMSSKLGAYSASKAAVNTLTVNFALELAPKSIRVNAVCPGIIAVKTLLDTNLAPVDALIKATPAGRLGVPLDVAKAVVFLASNDAQFITGVNLVIDGGFTLL